VLEEERETEREEAAELEVGETLPVPGEQVTFSQCCGSGSGIRCLFDPWFRIRDPE
jgi:hypothetical protein